MTGIQTGNQTNIVVCRLEAKRRPVAAATAATQLKSASSHLAKGRIPRVSKLMALALHFDEMLRQGLIKDQASLAKLGQVTRARLSQIMNLLNLAPDIQEQLLFLPAYQTGRATIILADMLPIANEPIWQKQRVLFSKGLEDNNS